MQGITCVVCGLIVKTERVYTTHGTHFKRVHLTEAASVVVIYTDLQFGHFSVVCFSKEQEPLCLLKSRAILNRRSDCGALQ